MATVVLVDVASHNQSNRHEFYLVLVEGRKIWGEGGNQQNKMPFEGNAWASKGEFRIFRLHNTLNQSTNDV